ncbi:CsbD family protein [Mixta gaviniae]|uniref:CsbD family protein n=1 Tax=Mixta gaviniae TaxID=665914 RepID=A0A1X1EAT8_9GAMM|nr:CsbD family protein [Mixta gaviniae]AUX93728.1 CsbD family protein [Mixta gaviniae]ORM86058.1 CsbD family protein [Mixta gaviniae]
MLGKIEDKVREGTGKAQEAYGRATDSYSDQAEGSARKYASQASYAVRDAADTVRSQVSSNPLGGLAVAAAAGVVLGYLLGRK